MSKAGFRELLVWQKSKALAVSIYKLTREGALARDFGLSNQMQRSAVSVASNIAEGDERNTDKESVRFFYIAKGSLAELITQLEIAEEIGLLSPEQLTSIKPQCAIIGRMLGALIKARSQSPIANRP